MDSKRIYEQVNGEMTLLQRVQLLLLVLVSYLDHVKQMTIMPMMQKKMRRAATTSRACHGSTRL